MANSAYSQRSNASETNFDNTYCVFLNLIEGVGFNLRDRVGDFNRDRVILYATLNNIKFEVEGHSLSQDSATIFNNCCIWETDMEVIKRMKTDNRPVKIECFLRPSDNNLGGSKAIGTLLLPIRGLTPISTLRNVQLKVQWHKLATLSSEWRHIKPELCLLILIVKKELVESGQLEALLGKGKKQDNQQLFSDSPTETAFMLQSQSNVYVQLLDHLGAIQIGNNQELDCDTFNVTLTFKQVRNIERLLDLDGVGSALSRRNSARHLQTPLPSTEVFTFFYDILGKPSHMEILINRFDCYTINDKITLSFRSSLQSLRSYFQRIFYLPINLYYRGVAIASYRMDFNKLLPEGQQFELKETFTKNGTFFFDRLNRMLSPRAPKPSLSFTFTIQQTTFNAKHNMDARAIAETFVPYKSSDIPKIDMENLRQGGTGLVPQQQESGEHLRVDCSTSTTSFEPRLQKELEQAAENAKQQNQDDEAKGVATTAAEAADVKANGEGVKPNEEMKAANTSEAAPVKPAEPDAEVVMYNIVQELEEWKAMEMQNFMHALKQKEEHYLQQVQQSWLQERAVLRARLEAKIARCDELNARLEKTHSEMQLSALKSQEHFNVAEKVKQEIESTYAAKFQMLQQQIEHLKVEVLQKDAVFEIKNKEIKFENKKLASEKQDLTQRLAEMEKQVAEFRKAQREMEQMQMTMQQMRNQSEEMHELEKSKNVYKRKWTKKNHEVRELKMKLIEQQEELEFGKNDKDTDYDCNKCLEEILSEERDALDSDRSELKHIKAALLTVTSTSSQSVSETSSDYADE